MATTRKTVAEIVADAKRTGKLHVEQHGEIRCQCGRQFVVGEVDGVPVGMHEEPMCADFRDRDLLDFLIWLNGVQGRRN